MSEPCSKELNNCPADIPRRIEELARANCRMNCTMSSLDSILRRMHNEVVKRNVENAHLKYHNKCSPVNCTVKQCADPCGPPPCHVDVTCPKYIDEVARKYRILWMHITQLMTDRSHLIVENEDLKQQICIMKYKYETKHDDREICICCGDPRPGYDRCGCCECLDDEICEC